MFYYSIIQIGDKYLLERQADDKALMKRKEYFHFDSKTEYWWDKDRFPEYYVGGCRTDYETCKEKFDSLTKELREKRIVLETTVPKTKKQIFFELLKLLLERF